MREIQDIFTEANEIAATKGKWTEKENEIISLDQAREHILNTNPSWKDGGESMVLIDSVAFAFMLEHNDSVTEKAEMELRQSLLQPRSIREIPNKVRDSLEDNSIDLKQMLRLHPLDMFKYYHYKYGKEATATEIYSIVQQLVKLEGR